MPEEPPLTYPAAPAASCVCLPAETLTALAEPKRRAILKLLADQGPLGVQQIAAALGRQETLIGRHLIALRQAGLINAVSDPAGDGRRQYYQIPPHLRFLDASGRTVLDFGIVALRLG